MFGGLASAMQTGFRGTGAEGGINPPMFKFSFGQPKPKEETNDASNEEQGE